MKIDCMVETFVKPIEKETIIMTDKTMEWCKIPYEGYPNGCERYGVKKYCPPNVPYRDDMLETYDTFTLVYGVFDIITYVKRNRKIHPDWSLKQLRNSRHWQGQLGRIMKAEIKKLEYDELFGAGAGILGCPSMEAVGVHVFATLQRNKIKFDKKARKMILMVALLVSDSKRKREQMKLTDF